MKEIDLHISVDEANLILEALGNLPFVKVFALIGKLQDQASRQLGVDGSPAELREDRAPILAE